MVARHFHSGREQDSDQVARAHRSVAIEEDSRSIIEGTHSGSPNCGAISLVLNIHPPTGKNACTHDNIVGQ